MGIQWIQNFQKFKHTKEYQNLQTEIEVNKPLPKNNSILEIKKNDCKLNRTCKSEKLNANIILEAEGKKTLKNLFQCTSKTICKIKQFLGCILMIRIKSSVNPKDILKSAKNVQENLYAKR